MFAVIVLAMIVLQNAPDPAATSAASLGQKLTGASPAGTGLQGLDTASPLGNLTFSAGCSEGPARLGRMPLLSDVSDLSGAQNASSSCLDAGTASFAPLLSAPGTFAFYRPVFTPSSVAGSGFAAPALHVPTTFTMNETPQRSFAIQHLALPREFGASGSTSAFQVHASMPAASTAGETRRPLDVRRTTASTTH